jgi:hypothetical protein
MRSAHTDRDTSDDLASVHPLSPGIHGQSPTGSASTLSATSSTSAGNWTRPSHLQAICGTDAWVLAAGVAANAVKTDGPAWAAPEFVFELFGLYTFLVAPSTRSRIGLLVGTVTVLVLAVLLATVADRGRLLKAHAGRLVARANPSSLLPTT